MRANHERKSFVIEFRFVFWLIEVISAHFPQAMQKREQHKRSHFDAFWHVKRWGVVFAIAKGIHVSHAPSKPPKSKDPERICS